MERYLWYDMYDIAWYDMAWYGMKGAGAPPLAASMNAESQWHKSTLGRPPDKDGSPASALF